MKKFFVLLELGCGWRLGLAGVLCMTILMSGCATSEKIAESLSQKNVAGSGFISIQNMGIDPESKIPSLKSTVISGDFQTIKSGTNYVNYRYEQSSAWYNAKNVTTRQSLTISVEGKTNMAEVLRACSNALNSQSTEQPSTINTVPEGSDVIEINGKKNILLPGTVNAVIITENGNLLIINKTPEFVIPTYAPAASDTIYVNELQINVPTDKINMTVETENDNIIIINPAPGVPDKSPEETEKTDSETATLTVNGKTIVATPDSFGNMSASLDESGNAVVNGKEIE